MDSDNEQNPGVELAKDAISGFRSPEVSERLQYLIFYLFTATRDLKTIHTLDQFANSVAKKELEDMRLSLADGYKDDPFFFGVLCSLVALISGNLPGQEEAVKAITTLANISTLLKKPALGTA